MIPIFEIETETQKRFIGNRETGRWVLADRLDEGVAAQLEKPLEKKEFSGISLVVLNTGRSCNLRCKYCHVGELKEQDADLSLEVGKKAIDRTLELTGNKHIIFHGSEPLINFGLLQKLLDYSRDKGHIEFSIQSNGTLLSSYKWRILFENEIGLGISLDGLRQHQDATRLYVDGRSTYDKIVGEISHFKKEQKGISVITVVSKSNVNDLEEIVNDFEKRGIESVSFSLLYASKSESELIPDNEVLFDNMKKVMDRYIEKTKNGGNPIKIRNLRTVLRTFFKEKITDNCVQCGGGTTHPLMAIDIDGSIYPCDFFWGKKEYCIGNIFDMSLNESFNSPKNFRVYRSMEGVKDCYDNCEWTRFCGGGCVGGSVIAGQGLASKSIYCDYYKRLFRYVAEKIPSFHESQILGKLLEIN